MSLPIVLTPQQTTVVYCTEEKSKPNLIHRELLALYQEGMQDLMVLGEYCNSGTQSQNLSLYGPRFMQRAVHNHGRMRMSESQAGGRGGEKRARFS